MNWAEYLEYLQIVLKEFDPTATPNEKVLICHFRNGFQPSIRAQ